MPIELFLPKHRDQILSQPKTKKLKEIHAQIKNRSPHPWQIETSFVPTTNLLVHSIHEQGKLYQTSEKVPKQENDQQVQEQYQTLSNLPDPLVRIIYPVFRLLKLVPYHL